MGITAKDFEEIICQRLRDYRKSHITLYYKHINPDFQVVHVPNGFGEVILKNGLVLKHTSFTQESFKGVINNFIFVETCHLG